MKYFCKSCATEATQREICSGCGSMMSPVSDKHMFVLEVIDQVISKEVDQAVVYERRGPFKTADEALEWWERHQAHEKYVGCTGIPALLEPPIHFADPDPDTN